MPNVLLPNVPKSTPHHSAKKPATSGNESSSGHVGFFVLAVIAALFWLGGWNRMSSVQSEAEPLLREMYRMESAPYLFDKFLESYVRGSFGDPFGTAFEEQAKDYAIRTCLQQLVADYEWAVWQ